jgi:hypothetical protein
MPKSLTKLESEAWTLHSLIATLFAAMPIDTIGCEVPAKSALLHLKELSAALANGLAEAADHA